MRRSLRRGEKSENRSCTHNKQSSQKIKGGQQLNKLRRVTLYQALYIASKGNTVGVTGNKPVVLSEQDFQQKNNCIVALGDNTCTGELLPHSEKDLLTWIQEPDFHRNLLSTGSSGIEANTMTTGENIWEVPQCISCREFDLLLNDGDSATYIDAESSNSFYHTYDVTRNGNDTVRVVFVNCTVCVYALGFTFSANPNILAKKMCDTILDICTQLVKQFILAKKQQETTEAKADPFPIEAQIMKSTLTRDVGKLCGNYLADLLKLVQLCYGYIYSVRMQLLGQTLALDKSYEDQNWQRDENHAHYKHDSNTGQYTLRPLLIYLSSVGRLAVDMNGTVMPDDAAKLQKNIKKGKKEMGVTAEIAEATYPAAITTKYKTRVLSNCKNVVSNETATNKKIEEGTLSVKCIGHCPNVQYIDFMSNGTDVLDFYNMLCGNSSNDTHHFEERVLQSVAEKLERCPHYLGNFYGTFIGLQTKGAPSESTPGAFQLDNSDIITFSEPHIENTTETFKYYREHPLNMRTDSNKYVPVKGVLNQSNSLEFSFRPLKDTYTYT